MNKRLQTMIKYIEPGRGFIDVGTDHGYLPAWMAGHGYRGNIIASDINPGPLKKAEENAEKLGLEGRIKFLLCDGLEACPPNDVDTIIIAGMGGDMICRILDMAEWCMDRRYKLILQPVTKAEILRYWLVNNEFEIFREELVSDKGIVYQLLVARFGGKLKLNDAELFLGKKSLCSDPVLYEQQRTKLIQRFEAAVDGMEHSRQKGAGAPALKLYRQILEELRQLR